MKGGVLWMTGVPGSGKTTTAKRLLARFAERGLATLWLDSDDLRSVVPVGYDDAGRDAFYALIGHLALLGVQGGCLVVISATASRRTFRDEVRKRLGARFVEVMLTTSPEALRRDRDVKGLYAKAQSGEITSLPGVGVPFESGGAELVIDTSSLTPEAVERLVYGWLEHERPGLLV